MKSLHLKLGRIKMFAIKTIINLNSVRSVSILIISLCVEDQ